MHLTKEENEMLEGKYGYPVQKSMEILVGVGECFDADRMIPVTSAHLTGGCAIASTGEAGVSFVKEMADKGGRFIPFTDTNISSIDPWLWREIGISEEFARRQMAMTDVFARMGAFLGQTCSPFLIGHVPRLGEHISWSESTALIFANSVLGARTNREGGPNALASALTGRTPEYGYHLDCNRRGELEIVVTAKLDDLHDYGTLGYFAGKIAGQRVPVFTGLSPSVSWEELKLMGAATATSGSVTLYHVVGVTPEAPTEEAAFGPGKVGSWPRLEFGEKELRETEELISRATAREVDLVVFGCPHASIKEISDVARLLSGKKLKSGVDLWIFAPLLVKSYAERMGYLNIIESAGARILCETCPAALPRELLKGRDIRTAATNSAKMTYYIAGEQSVLSHYGSTERCVEAAISGVWR